MKFFFSFIFGAPHFSHDVVNTETPSFESSTQISEYPIGMEYTVLVECYSSFGEKGGVTRESTDELLYGRWIEN